MITECDHKLEKFFGRNHFDHKNIVKKFVRLRQRFVILFLKIDFAKTKRLTLPLLFRAIIKSQSRSYPRLQMQKGTSQFTMRVRAYVNEPLTHGSSLQDVHVEIFPQ